MNEKIKETEIKNGCAFCKAFDFAKVKAVVNKDGAFIMQAICNTKFPKVQQFNFCPICGIKLDGAKNG